MCWHLSTNDYWSEVRTAYLTNGIQDETRNAYIQVSLNPTHWKPNLPLRSNVNVKQIRKRFSFVSDDIEDGYPLAVWSGNYIANNLDTNGICGADCPDYELENFVECIIDPAFPSIHYASVDKSSLEMTGDKLSGDVYAYTYALYINGGPEELGDFLCYWPVSPSELYVKLHMRGIFDNPSPRPPRMVTGLSGFYHEPYGTPKVYLSWDRSDPAEGVISYTIQRADGEEGDPEDFYYLASVGNGGSGPVIEYSDVKLRPVDAHRYRVRAVNNAGPGDYCGDIFIILESGGGIESHDVDIVALPSELTLDQNYPNPFNPTTTVRYGLPKSSRVNLRIMNTRGQTVKTLVDEEKSAGWYTVTWDGKNESGQQVSSGIYLYLLETNEGSILKKMTLIR